MLHRKSMGCYECVDNSSCEFSSEFCPKATLDLSPDNDLAADPVLKKYQELYRRLDR